LSERWWLWLQTSYDTAMARRKMGKALEEIVPLKEVA
jgi:plasmid maintenance system antidote protein VapI